MKKITKEQILKEMKKRFQKTRKKQLIDRLMNIYSQRTDRILLAMYKGMFDIESIELETEEEDKG